MNERYDRQTEQLRTSLLAAREQEQLSYDMSMLKDDVRAHIADLTGRETDEVYYRNLLDGITVHADRRVELRLNLLPREWRFVLDSLDDIHRRLDSQGFRIDPSVPTKGSKWEPEGQLPQIEGNPNIFYVNDPNMPIPGKPWSPFGTAFGNTVSCRPCWPARRHLPIR